MIKWSEDKLIRLEHHFMRGTLSFSEIAIVFDLDRSNLLKVVKRYNVNTNPTSLSYGRKERTICYQLRKLGLEHCDIITPTHCPDSGVKLTYDIYFGKPNSAIVKATIGGRYIVKARKEVYS